MQSRENIHNILSNGIVDDYPNLELDGNLTEHLLSWANSYIFAINQLCRRHKLNMLVSFNTTDADKQTVCLVIQCFDPVTGFLDKKTVLYIPQRQGALTFRRETIEAFSDRPKIDLAHMILNAVVEAA